MRGQHAAIGGSLCGLGVKMRSWHDRFPSHDVGGPLRRGEFIMTDLRPGFEKIRLTVASAPDT